MVRWTMKTVTANAFLFVELVRQAIEESVAWKRGMKCRIENCDMRLRRKNTARLANSGGVHRIVERRKRTQRFNLRQHLVVDQDRAGELLSAVDNAMPDDRNGLLLLQLREQGCERAGVSFRADPFDLAVRVLFRMLCVEEAILQGRRAAVENQDALRSLALQFEETGDIFLPRKRRRFLRIAHHALHAFRDCARDLLHRPRRRHDVRSKESQGHEHDPAVRGRDKIGDPRIAGHERHFSEGLARAQLT